MAPTLEPPPWRDASPTLQPNNVSSEAKSIISILKDLHGLLHNVTLPKTKTTKTCQLPLDVFLKARTLITSACSAAERQQQVPQLSSIKEQLEVISKHIGLGSSPAQTHTTPPAQAFHRDNTFDITLVQIDRQHPVLQDHTNEEICSIVHEALETTAVFYDPKSDNEPSQPQTPWM
ncbi:hypothetical protein M422DRAFT_263081 [Sphaerobolus stellatus SS14]|uniref:Uncharacterized protein n=1 Tax=Sphaerobolus stellatus (strain SS14) TaxID=990650 RepID=A0A0C9TWF2_SPHS4|nr:hypothetical protein M422DRAFT_263081 [Sphaerobolus stellatus SS14]